MSNWPLLAPSIRQKILTGNPRVPDMDMGSDCSPRLAAAPLPLPAPAAHNRKEDQYQGADENQRNQDRHRNDRHQNEG